MKFSIWTIGILLTLSSCFEGGNFDPVDQQIINKGPILPVIETGTPSLIQDSTIEVVAQILEIGKKPILEHGHTWSGDQSQESLKHLSAYGPRINNGSFTTLIPIVEKGKTYYIQAYAITVVGTTFGEVQSITID